MLTGLTPGLIASAVYAENSNERKEPMDVARTMTWSKTTLLVLVPLMPLILTACHK